MPTSICISPPVQKDWIQSKSIHNLDIYNLDTTEHQNKNTLEFLDSQFPRLGISNCELFPDWIMEIHKLLNEMEEMIHWEQLGFDFIETLDCGVPDWITPRYYESIKLLDEMEEMILWEQLWFDLAEANVTLNGWVI